MRFGRLILFVCVLAGLPSVGASELLKLPANPYALDGSRSCGPRCIAFLDQYFDGSASYETILKACPPGPFGTNLEQLSKALTDLKFHVVPFKTGVSQLERLKHPAILHLQRTESGGHFIVSLGWDDEKQRFRIYNPPSELVDVDRAWISERATGLGLVVSRDPLPPIEQLLHPPGIRAVDWLATGLLLTTLVFVVLRPGPSWNRSVSKAATATSTLLLFVVLNGCAQNSAAEVNPHEAVVGQVLDGATIRHTFRVPNTTDQPFRVLQVKRSCSCQVVDVDTKREFAPGEVVEISVEVPTAGREGPYRQHFQVLTKSSTGQEGEIQLALAADVVAKIKAIPTRVMFGNVQGGEPRETKVSIKTNKPNLGDSFVSAEAVGNPSLTVQLAEKASGLLTFDVKLSDDAPPGDIYGELRFRFDDEEVPVVEIPVLGKKVLPVKVIPRVLTIDSNATLAKFRVQGDKGVKFKIISVDGPSGVQVSGVRDAEAESFDLELGVPADVRRAFTLTIKTNLPGANKISLPCVLQKAT